MLLRLVKNIAKKKEVKKWWRAYATPAVRKQFWIFHLQTNRFVWPKYLCRPVDKFYRKGCAFEDWRAPEVRDLGERGPVACSPRKIKGNRVVWECISCVLRTVLKAYFCNLPSLESPVSRKRTVVAHGEGEVSDRFSSVLSCEDLFISSLHRSANIWIFIYLKSSFTRMFIWTQFIDQLPVGLLAQLVEHCTGIAEVMGSNPVRAWIFFRSYLQLLVSVVFLASNTLLQSNCIIP